MKRLILLAAFALGIAGAAPAHAQTVAVAGQTLSPQMQALADVMGREIGDDTVVMLYTEVAPSLNVEGAAQLMFRFQPRGTSLVRVYDGEPERIIAAFVEMIVSERAAGRTWQAMTLVIDHGKVRTVFVEPGAIATGTTYDARLEAATARVFPGLTVEPYKASDAR